MTLSQGPVYRNSEHQYSSGTNPEAPAKNSSQWDADRFDPDTALPAFAAVGALFAVHVRQRIAADPDLLYRDDATERLLQPYDDQLGRRLRTALTDATAAEVRAARTIATEAVSAAMGGAK